jgi:hypothetical protein
MTSDVLWVQLRFHQNKIMNNNSSHQNGFPESHPQSEIQDLPSDPSSIAPRAKEEVFLTKEGPQSSIENPESSIEPEGTQSNPHSSESQESIDPPIHQSGSASTPHSAALRARHRRGNVARLPKPIRDRINQMLDDGTSYPKIIKALGDDAKGITARCVMSWKKGGYQDYLRYQHMLDQCRARQLRIAPLLNRRNNINTFQATQQLATAQICETIVELGTDILRQAVAENPMNYFRMLNSFARLANGGLRCKRHLLDEALAKAERRPAPSNGKRGMSPEQMAEFRELLDNL